MGPALESDSRKPPHARGVQPSESSDPSPSKTGTRGPVPAYSCAVWAHRGLTTLKLSFPTFNN